jgi:hypothetical protein
MLIPPLVGVFSLLNSSLSLSSCRTMADGLGVWGDRTEEGRDRMYPGVK